MEALTDEEIRSALRRMGSQEEDLAQAEFDYLLYCYREPGEPQGRTFRGEAR